MLGKNLHELISSNIGQHILGAHLNDARPLRTARREQAEKSRSCVKTG
jgi:hypothetical protein